MPESQEKIQSDSLATLGGSKNYGLLSIVDRDRLLLHLLEAFFARNGLFDVVCHRNWDGTLAAPRAADGRHLILIDPETPNVGGLKGLWSVIERYPQSKVVVFSGRAASSDVAVAREFGAWGFLSKTMSPMALCSALLLIASSEKYFTQADMEVATQKARSASSSMSEINWKVLRLVGAGKTNRDIGGALGLSEPTIKMHVRSLMTKTRCRNRTELAIYYITECA